MAIFKTLQAAESVGCSELHILRAIAIGELKASQVGQGGAYRVDSIDLSDWARSGFPRFDFPESIKAGWYDDIERGIRMESDAFTGALADALKAWADTQAEPAANISTVTVTPTATMRTLAAAAVPVSPFRIKSKKTSPAPYANRLESAMILATRRAAHAAVRRIGGVPLHTLFRSRGQFEKISSEAATAALNQTVNYRRIWPAKVGFGRSHDVRYSVRLGDLVTGGESAYITKLIGLAF